MNKMKSVKIKTINPATEEILAEYDALTPDQVNHEVNDARKVYESIWKKFDISERAKLLRTLGHILLNYESFSSNTALAII